MTKLMLNRANKKILGVCAGLSDWSGIDATDHPHCLCADHIDRLWLAYPDLRGTRPDPRLIAETGGSGLKPLFYGNIADNPPNRLQPRHAGLGETGAECQRMKKMVDRSTTAVTRGAMCISWPKSGKRAMALIRRKLRILSRAGCRIITPMYLNPGASLYITLPGFAALETRIAWHVRDEYGCEFVQPLHEAIYDHIVKAHPAAIRQRLMAKFPRDRVYRETPPGSPSPPRLRFSSGRHAVCRLAFWRMEQPADRLSPSKARTCSSWTATALRLARANCALMA